MAKVYIAAPWISKDDMWDVARQLEKAGHTITHAWWDSPEEANESESYRDPVKLQEYAYLDFNGVCAADVVVVLNTAKSEGKAVEQGIALARGIPIVIIGTRGKESKNVFHYLPAYTWVPSLQMAIQVLGDMQLGQKG